MTGRGDWDDEISGGLFRDELMPEEAVPYELNASVNEALAARAEELRHMNWSMTAWVSVAAGFVLLAHGAAALTLAAVVSRVAVAVLYGFAVRSLVARTA